MAQVQRKKNNEVKSSQKTFIVLGVGVLIAAIIAISASGNSTSSVSTEPTTSVAGSVTVGEYQPVSITGTKLSKLGDGGADPSTDSAMGKTAPTLRGFNFAGTPVSIVPGANSQPIMVVFLAHWCPHCNREVPRLIDWKEKGQVPQGLRVIGITTSSLNDQANWPPSAWIQTMKWPFEVMADSEAADAAGAYGVDGFPFIAILDAQGHVVGRHSGELEIADLDAFVRSSLASSASN